MGERPLLAASGAVAVVAGAYQALRGTAGVHRAAAVRSTVIGDRNVDSELRFHAVWYAVAGAQMLRAAAARDDRDTALLAAGWAGAALSRLLSMRAVGVPSRRFVALAAAEAALAVQLRPRAVRPGAASRSALR